jgi:hypothetical protein
MNRARDVLLGRNALNKLTVLLDGPGRVTEVLSRRPGDM